MHCPRHFARGIWPSLASLTVMNLDSLMVFRLNFFKTMPAYKKRDIMTTSSFTRTVMA